MKKSREGKYSLLILALGFSTIVTGCGALFDTPIIGGLDSSEAMKIGKLVVSTDVAKLFTMDLADKYKEELGGSIKNDMKFGNDSFDEHVKTEAQNELSIVYALSDMATENNISLSEVELSAIKAAAKTYVSGLSKQEISYANVTTESVENLYENYCLADKYYLSKTGSAAVDVSDEEARVIKIQYIYIDNNTDRDEAVKILKQVKKQVTNGYQDFLVEASRYTNASDIELKLCKNKAKAEFEQEAFNLQDGEMSNIVKTDQGVYLIKCLDAYVEDDTANNKLDIEAQKRAEIVKSDYSKYIEDLSTDINDDVWSEIEISKDADIKADNLFDIYETIEGEE